MTHNKVGIFLIIGIWEGQNRHICCWHWKMFLWAFKHYLFLWRDFSLFTRLFWVYNMLIYGLTFQLTWLNKFCFLQDKPHKCHLCDKSFPTPGDLKSHMFIHSGSWPFKCPICTRGFGKHALLKTHMLMHAGRKNYHLMPLLSDRNLETSIGSLWKCALLSIGEAGFTCGVCEKIFPNLDVLQEHVKIHQTGVISTCRGKLSKTSALSKKIDPDKYFVPKHLYPKKFH